MANIHAKRVGQQRWKVARKQSNMIAIGFRSAVRPPVDDSKETSFCGERSNFVCCVPKVQQADWYYPLNQKRKE